MARRRIRFGIIGLGLMGKEFGSAAARWCHLLSEGPVPEIAGVCDANPAAFGWFRDNFPSIGIATQNYQDLLGAKDIEAVYCAVPHNLHGRMYADIVEAGKHLLGEKPFGIDRAANESILAAAARHPGVAVRCSSEFPFFPAVQRIVRAAREKRFGTILEVECGFLHSSDMDPNKPINWKRRAETNGEYGCMGDLGMHVFHVPLRLGWRPRNVRAVLSKVVRERPDAAGKMVPCDTWDNATLFCEVPAEGGGSFPLTAKTFRIAPGETDTWYLSIKGTRFSARFSTAEPRTLWTLDYSGGAQAWDACRC